ncbi:IclR family transcriptional regulator [Cohnella zeiphila]|uniref:IclR family transcriptional regulator n=1 Tax=Cohnella zeiphila TaxID=2761120 RepID=A0A7X0VZ55_9BACL|nr:IclR family transcriptional regulator [Cohnella zeiphila]MBB6733643.1 IclR family transcriptional regulator [Cohnella zeiphila]
MERKYWAPAVERAHLVLQAVAANPARLRLTDLTEKTGINKSTMFSLLHTMEELEWLRRDGADCYALGSIFASLGSAYLSGHPLIDRFLEKAKSTVERIGETVQLSRLERREIVYLAKKEAPHPVRLLSEPGSRMPAHSTAMGKALLAGMADPDIRKLYEGYEWERLTPHTIGSVEPLLAELASVRREGCAFDAEEAVLGFRCVAAPVLDAGGSPQAAVSVSMLSQAWESKRDAAERAIRELAAELSS